MPLTPTVSLFDSAPTNVLPSVPPGNNSLRGRDVHSAAESSATWLSTPSPWSSSGWNMDPSILVFFKHVKYTY